MTAKTKNHIMAMLMSDVDERRACLRVLEDERRDATSTDELRDISAVIRRVRAALKQTEDALDEIVEVVTKEDALDEIVAMMNKEDGS